MTLPARFGTVGSFGEASEIVIDYLQAAIPLSFWSVTRHESDSQIYLTVHDSAYGLKPGDSCLWSDSMCQFMVAGVTPPIAPDVNRIPEYATAGVRATVPIAAYVGLPIVGADDQVFGTLCGLDPLPQSEHLVDQAPLLAVLAQLLSAIFLADSQRTEASRRAERFAAEAEIDVLTGLYNRRGWDRFLQLEEARYRRFGDIGSVIVLDLDGVKSVNDQFGHDAGDAHIRRAAHVLQESTRAVDIVARLGGDEFGILAANTGAEQAEVLVERLEEQLAIAGTPGAIGHAPYSIGAGFQGAWRAADERMYHRKRTSRRPPRTT